MIQDAMQAWITTAIEDDEEIPEPGRNRYSGRFVRRLPRSLHRQLAVLAAHERISLNQYILYRLSTNVSETLLRSMHHARRG